MCDREKKNIKKSDRENEKCGEEEEEEGQRLSFVMNTRRAGAAA